MEIGSYKDIHNWITHLRKWIKSPWFKPAAILAVLSYVLWQAVLWALMPGVGIVNELYNEEDTALAIAQRRYGPILLVKNWISDPEGAWGEKFQVLNQWGMFETIARLLLIIVIIWIALCFVALIPKLKSAHPGAASKPTPPPT